MAELPRWVSPCPLLSVPCEVVRLQRTRPGIVGINYPWEPWAVQLEGRTSRNVKTAVPHLRPCHNQTKGSRCALCAPIRTISPRWRCASSVIPFGCSEPGTRPSWGKAPEDHGPLACNEHARTSGRRRKFDREGLMEGCKN